MALADVQTEEGQRLCSELAASDRQALYVTCDVSDADSVKRAIDATVERFGRLDILFANAGINGVWSPIDELQPDEWERTLDINLKGTYLTVHFAVPISSVQAVAVSSSPAVSTARAPSRILVQAPTAPPRPAKSPL